MRLMNDITETFLDNIGNLRKAIKKKEKKKQEKKNTFLSFLKFQLFMCSSNVSRDATRCHITHVHCQPTTKCIKSEYLVSVQCYVPSVHILLDWLLSIKQFFTLVKNCFMDRSQSNILLNQGPLLYEDLLVMVCKITKVAIS